MKKPVSQSAAVRSFAHIWKTLSEYLSRKETLLTILSMLAIALAFGGTQASAQSFDALGGSDIGSKLCTLGKSIDGSTIGYGIAIAVIGFGALKWLPTRKDGIPEMTGGLIGAIVVRNFNNILGAFGLSC